MGVKKRGNLALVTTASVLLLKGLLKKAGIEKYCFRCNSKQSCEIEASNDHFGEPCPGVIKYLEVTYSCDATTTTTTDTSTLTTTSTMSTARTLSTTTAKMMRCPPINKDQNCCTKEYPCHNGEVAWHNFWNFLIDWLNHREIVIATMIALAASRVGRTTAKDLMLMWVLKCLCIEKMG